MKPESQTVEIKGVGELNGTVRDGKLCIPFFDTNRKVCFGVKDLAGKETTVGKITTVKLTETEIICQLQQAPKKDDPEGDN